MNKIIDSLRNDILKSLGCLIFEKNESFSEFGGIFLGQALKASRTVTGRVFNSLALSQSLSHAVPAGTGGTANYPLRHLFAKLYDEQGKFPEFQDNEDASTD